MGEFELGFGQVLPLLRVMITGTMQGPPIFDTAALIGKEESIERLKEGMSSFNKLAGTAS